MNRTVFNMVRSMIFGSGLALTYWSEAAEHAAYILNRSTTRAILKRASPIEVLTGRAPSLQGIVVFGSPCMVWWDLKKKALVRHEERALILGISEETKGYKVLLLKDKVVTTTRHITNIETIDGAANRQIQRALHDDRR
uniref:Copialike retrotransposable element putative n=1 Tax=Albugo laibachii Nc14 TaxID=890382 RepID=F0WXS3_9STRA|nr:copialike retrotransposable element putative [Albugo laibachii Nc14]|eukprot:CCA26270.1 copialike retrotransposable element putative [Albugo laibachii Nc14]